MRADVFAAVSLGALLAVGCATTTSSAGSATPPSAAPASEAPRRASRRVGAEADPVEAKRPPRRPLPRRRRSAARRASAPIGLRRSALKRTVDAGLGRWLQTVSVDPLLARGHFRGWIIRSFNADDACYAGVDLRAGDVVTRVNGRGVEHPEEALDVWTKLPSSSELVIDFLRDGQARKVRFGIVDP